MKNKYREKSMNIQLKAFTWDLYGVPLEEIAKRLSKEYDILKLKDKDVQRLIDAESVLYGIASSK